MRILNTEQMRMWELDTINKESISSIDLMERAAKACADWISNKYSKENTFHVFCGNVNNGGDGLAIARLLSTMGYPTIVYIVTYSQKDSPDFSKNKKQIIELNEVNVKEITNQSDVDLIGVESGIIIDALIGIRINRPIEGLLKDIIAIVNNTNLPIISIDIPSGLFPEDNSLNNNKNIIRATHTLTFQYPKLSFLFPENAIYVGCFYVLDIELNSSYRFSQNTPYYFIEKKDIKQIYKLREKFSHKGTFGNVLILVGSHGKIGAAVLASKACLRVGAGLVTAHVPRCGYQILQTAIPEAMVSTDSNENFVTEIPLLDKHTVLAVGPGLGTASLTQNVVKFLLQNHSLPLVIDADAINIISENKTWLSFVAPGTIFTPHYKEFERLVGKCQNSYERILKQIEFSKKFNLYLILKGSYTSISCPNGEVYFNSTGNPGMAKAGSGDVLTGMLAGLIAQGYNTKQACILGVYLHGLAGDIMAKQVGEESLLANDIINGIGQAYQNIKYTDQMFR